MVKIEAIIRDTMLEVVKQKLDEAGVAGITAWEVKGFGHQKGQTTTYRGTEYIVDFRPKVKIELVVADQDAERITKTIAAAARTGSIGDGKIFVFPITQCIRIRTGESGIDAI
jgi:nitrogen regulatory protein P-II 1